jgi:hypothetical protein
MPNLPIMPTFAGSRADIRDELKAHQSGKNDGLLAVISSPARLR